MSVKDAMMMNAYSAAERELAQLRSQVATLEQLIDVHEQVSITQSQHLEDMLASFQNQSRILQSVLNSIDDGVVVADVGGRVVLANPAAERMCGQPLVGMVLGERGVWPGVCLPDAESPYPMGVFPLVRALQGAVVEAVEGFALGVSGGVWVSMTARPLCDDQGVQRGAVMVFHDVSGRKHAEAAQQVYQEQVIAAQQAALRELSTPIIPLTDGVIVMPLIGSIDSARAQQVIETLLEGVGRYHARFAILDITGVQIVDSQIANALIHAAQAVRLLGAHVILTGIRPEVAQILVGLGIDLSTLITRASLQSGVEFAMSRNVR